MNESVDWETSNKRAFILLLQTALLKDNDTTPEMCVDALYHALRVRKQNVPNDLRLAVSHFLVWRVRGGEAPDWAINRTPIFDQIAGY